MRRILRHRDPLHLTEEKIAISAWATYQGPRNPSKEETHLRKPGLLGTPACEEQLARSVDLSDPPQLERCKRELGGNDRRVEAQFLQVLREHDRHGALEPLSSPRSEEHTLNSSH